MISNKDYVEQKFLKSFGNLFGCFQESEAMVAGGVFTSLYTNQEINDLDVYFPSKEKAGEFLEDLNQGRVVSVTSKSVTIAGVPNFPLIQVIWSLPVKDLNELFRSFDFTINMAGYDFGKKEFVYHPSFMSDLAGRRLSFNSETAFPIVSALRVNKYRDRGYSISRKEMLKILLKISTLKIETAEELSRAVGGMYGEAIKFSVTSGKIDLNTIIDTLSDTLTNDREYSFLRPDMEPFTGIVENLSTISSILTSEEDVFKDGWIKSHDAEPRAIYLVNGYKNYIHLAVATSFAPEKEIISSIDPETTHMVYKWVRKEDNTTYTSFHKDTFKYKIGEIIQSDYPGMYFVFGADNATATYARFQGSHLICCMVKEKHRVGNTSQFTQCIPLHEVEEDKIKALNEKDPLDISDLLYKNTTVK